MIGTSFTVVALTFSLFLVESPKFLYTKGRYDEARKALQRVAEFNGAETPQDYIFDTELSTISGAQLPLITKGYHEPASTPANHQHEPSLDLGIQVDTPHSEKDTAEEEDQAAQAETERG